MRPKVSLRAFRQLTDNSFPMCFLWASLGASPSSEPVHFATVLGSKYWPSKSAASYRKSPRLPLSALYVPRVSGCVTRADEDRQSLKKPRYNLLLLGYTVRGKNKSMKCKCTCIVLLPSPSFLHCV